MIKLKLHKIIIDNKKFGYWSNDIKNPRRICLLLSPGSYSGKFFKNFEKYFSDKDLYICPDFPARGYSEPQDNNSIKGVTETITKFIDALCLKDIYLAGFSYATQIATELLNINEKRFKKVIFVASGEFFSTVKRIVLKIIFLPLMFSNVLRYKIRRYVLPYIYVPNKNLKEINLQWLSTLDYKISTKQIITIPTVFLDFINDQYVTSKSKFKLKQFFINSKTITVNEIHPSNIINFDRLFKNYWEKIYE